MKAIDLQDNGRQKLIDTLLSDREQQNPEAVAEINKHLDELVLTNEEQAVLDGFRQILDEIFPMIQYTQRIVFNEEVNYTDLYFPFLSDQKKTKALVDDHDGRLGSNLADIGERIKEGLIQTAQTPKGPTKSRKEAPATQFVDINAGRVMHRYLDNMAYLIEMGETVKDLTDLTKDPRFDRIAGDIGAEYVKKWLIDIATKGSVGGRNVIIDIFRKNIGVGVLGWKATAALIQPSAIIDGAQMIGPGYATYGINKFLDPTNKEWREYVDQFPELRDRLGGEVALRELLQESWWDKRQNESFTFLKALDTFAASAIVIGAYQKKMDELGLEVKFDETPNQEAMFYAQNVMTLTQSSSQLKDLPPTLSRGAFSGNRSVDRAVLQFQNFLISARFNRILHQGMRVPFARFKDARSEGKGVMSSVYEGSKPVTSVALYTMAAAMYGAGMRSAIYAMLASLSADDDKQDKVWDRALQSFIFELAGNVPLASNLYATSLYDSGLFPMIDIIGDTLDGVTSAFTGKSTESKTKGAIKAGTTILTGAGVPGIVQIDQLLDPVVDRAFGGGSSSRRSSSGGVISSDGRTVR
jgi:hypothetical protein